MRRFLDLADFSREQIEELLVIARRLERVPEPDALREASYFVERLETDQMPLAGLVVNRTHPVLAAVPAKTSRRFSWS